MQVESLKDLFVLALQELYSAETQLLKLLPKLIRAAAHPRLKELFSEHLKQTQQHAFRLERIFKMLDEDSKGPNSRPMEALIDESRGALNHIGARELLDAGLIAATQKIEHYEIASYGNVQAWAGLMGLSDVAELIGLSLREEKDMDEMLTQLALSSINFEALAP